METGPDRLVVDGELITEGTSLYFRRTHEIAWLTEIRDHLIHVETITDSFERHEAQFVKKIYHEEILVESQPAFHRQIQ
jgi:hypothetical protein